MENLHVSDSTKTRRELWQVTILFGLGFISFLLAILNFRWVIFITTDWLEFYKYVF